MFSNLALPLMTEKDATQDMALRELQEKGKCLHIVT